MEITLTPDDTLITQFKNKVAEPTQHDELGIFVYDGDTLLGGVYGNLNGTWLYVDILWVADSERGKGLGTRLMHALHHAAVERGYTRALLGTADFQARPFYEKLGYQVAATYELNTQYRGYIMACDLTTHPPMPVPELTVEAPLVEEHSTALVQGLRAYNERFMGVFAPTPVFALAHEEDEVRGGIQGIFLDYALLLREAWFGENANALMDALEAEARQRQIPYIAYYGDSKMLVTVLQARGYQPHGQVKDYPEIGKTTYMFDKRWDD